MQILLYFEAEKKEVRSYQNGLENKYFIVDKYGVKIRKLTYTNQRVRNTNI